MRIDAAPDTTPPVIALRGTNPATVIVNSTYTEPGAVCTDDGYGSTTLTSSGDTSMTQAPYGIIPCDLLLHGRGRQCGHEPVSRAVIVKAAPPTAVLTLNATSNFGNGTLTTANGIAVFESGGNTYAAVTIYDVNGVQILNITNPDSITAAGRITDGGTRELYGAYGITTFVSGGHIYAAVASYTDNGVQILNVTDPSNITAAGSIDDTDSSGLVLGGARGIATFESGDRTYAAVTASYDNGVQILDVTYPYGIIAADSIDDTDSLELKGPRGITIFESGGRTYAAVTGNRDNGVQILDVTDPYRHHRRRQH